MLLFSQINEPTCNEVFHLTFPPTYYTSIEEETCMFLNEQEKVYNIIFHETVVLRFVYAYDTLMVLTGEGNIVPFIPHFHHIHSHNTKMYIHILGNGTHRVPLFTKYTLFTNRRMYLLKSCFSFLYMCTWLCVL